KHWRVSHRERKTQAHLSDRQRRLTAQRKSLHGRLAHTLIRQGNTFLLEKVSYSSWQRRFGRSVQRHAPGMFVSILTRLAASAGGMIVNVPTRQTKLSQTCQCGQVKKKPLSLRVHLCEGCGVQMQRDLYSAYLIRFVDPQTHLLHADQAQAAWPGWEPIRAARRGSRLIPLYNRRVKWRNAASPCGGGRPPCGSRRSPASGVPAKPKSPDAVASANPREPDCGGGGAS
ncbi:MAG: zinc ribbon domain-containing protein, partial [Ktedonobacterales bacterium]